MTRMPRFDVFMQLHFGPACLQRCHAGGPFAFWAWQRAQERPMRGEPASLWTLAFAVQMRESSDRLAVSAMKTHTILL